MVLQLDRQQPHRLPLEFIRELTTRCTHQTPSCPIRSLSEVSIISREGQSAANGPLWQGPSDQPVFLAHPDRSLVEAQLVASIAQLECLDAGSQYCLTVRSHAALLADLDQQVYGGAVRGRSEEPEGHRLNIRRRIGRATACQKLDATNQIRSTHVGHDALGELSKPL